MRHLLISILIHCSTTALAIQKVAIVFPDTPNNPNSVGSHAMCMAKAVIGSHDTGNLNVKFFTNSRDPIHTQQVVQKIINEKYELVLGTTLSSQAIVASKLLDSAKIPFIAPLATHPEVTKNKPLSIRIPYSDETQASLLAKASTEIYSAKRILLVYNKSLPYSTYIADSYKQEIKNSKVTTYPYVEGLFQVEDIRRKYIDGKFDLIFAPIYSIDMAKLYNKFVSNNSPAILLGGDAVGGRKNFLDAILPDEKTVQLTFVRQSPKVFEGPYLNEYKRLFKQYCKGSSNMVSAATFDLIRSTLKVLQQDKHSKESFVAAFKRQEFNGLMGKFNYSKKTGEPVKDLFLYQIKNKNVRYFKKITNPNK